VGSDLHVPDGPPTAAAVVLHPHPGMGGDRHHPLVVAVAQGLAARSVAALRIDLPDPDPAASSAQLVAAAESLADEVGVDRLFLVGYSWGSVVAASSRPAGLVARVLVAPPVSMLDLAEPDGTPTLVLVPAHDQYGPPDVVSEVVASWPDTTMEIVEGCDHFLLGAVDRIAARAVEWLLP
jgi:alpha/beta superfamily hydrolase